MHSTRITKVLTISSAARALDLGQNNGAQPSGWQNADFDDSAWDSAAPLSPALAACVRGKLSDWGNQPAYWGANQSDYYLFRRTFTLPPATDYYGSLLTVGGNIHNGDGNSQLTVYVNGAQVLQTVSNDINWNYAIGDHLQAGPNVIAVYAGPDSGNACSALTFSATIRLHNAQGTTTIAPVAQAPEDNKRITISMDKRVTALDLTSNNNSPPDGWQNTNFPVDSKWRRVTLLPPALTICVRGKLSDWGNQPAYWGANQSDYYLFRRTFTLPPATDYYGSLLTVGGNIHNGDGNSQLTVYVNGAQVLQTVSNDINWNYAIGDHLQAGPNVIAVYAGPDSGNACSALTFSATIRLHAETTATAH